MLHAAVALADTEGIEALSMRRLARELGVEAMSLYNHVADKDEILAGIIDVVVLEIELPSDEADWKAALRRNSISARDVLLRHRWASALWMSRQAGGGARLRNADWVLRTLREGGLPKEAVYHAFHVLQAYVLGFTALHLSASGEGGDVSRTADRVLAQFGPGEYPDLVEHARQHLEQPEGGEGGFECGLDVLLDGLERLQTVDG